MLKAISHSDLSEMPTSDQSNCAHVVPSTRPCRICQVQIWIYWVGVTGYFDVLWEAGVLAQTMMTKTIVGAASLAAFAAFQGCMAEDSYYCGDGRQTEPGRHRFGRMARGTVRDVKWLAAWFRGRCASSQRCDSKKEPEVDDDYDRCDVE